MENQVEPIIEKQKPNVEWKQEISLDPYEEDVFIPPTNINSNTNMKPLGSKAMKTNKYGDVIE